MTCYREIPYKERKEKVTHVLKETVKETSYQCIKRKVNQLTQFIIEQVQVQAQAQAQSVTFICNHPPSLCVLTPLKVSVAGGFLFFFTFCFLSFHLCMYAGT